MASFNQNEIKRMKSLMTYGISESVQKNTGMLTPKVEFSQKAADGKTYGILREFNKFYIKVAPAKNDGCDILAEDYDYIGGFMNKKQHEYSSYAVASKQFDLEMMAINEKCAAKEALKSFKPVPQAEWVIQETKDMRKEIERFKEISRNVGVITEETKGDITLAHTLPEAPSSNPSEKDVNTPFTDTAVANGDKDFNEKDNDYQAAGKPFDPDTKDKKMFLKIQDGEKPMGETHDTYTEKPQYVPKDSVAGQHPSGGRVVRVSEGKVFKLTEDQAKLWSKIKDTLDTSKGTEVGDSAPFVDKVNEGEGEPVHSTEDQKRPTPGTSGVKSSEPFNNKVNETSVQVSDVAGMPDTDADVDVEDDSDVPFPEVDDNDIGGSYLDTEEEFNQWLDEHPELEDNDDDAGDDDDLDDGVFDIDLDFRGFEDLDFYESKNRNRRQVSEDTLNVFGKHPAYRKPPMTTPPNVETAKDGAHEWDDDSAQGEEPYGKKIGDGAPFTKTIDILTDAFLKELNFQKKA